MSAEHTAPEGSERASDTNHCPVTGRTDSQDPDQRKATDGEWDTHVPLERVGDTWRITSLELARQVLRSQGTLQAGFRAEQARAGLRKARIPVLFADGPEHREQRSKIARFFAPTTVDTTYRELMDRYAREAMAELDRTGSLDLSEATMGYSVRVAAHIVGLEGSDPDAMGKRLMKLFGDHGDPTEAPRTPWRRAWFAIRSVIGNLPVATFTWRDVRPAVRARKRRRRADVISHLLDQQYTLTEIATECLTYAAAGMITTREFIAMAAWHLLDNRQLLERYKVAGQGERYAILYDILRLEPVVGLLYRRAAQDIELEHRGQHYKIPAGDLITMSIKDTNVDAEVFDTPREVCPGRDITRGVRPEGAAFGDGAHRCPGHFVAIQESDVFLRELFERDVIQLTTPELFTDPLIAAYRVEGLRVGYAAAGQSGVLK
ncbi:cytochrome P450 [Kocuria sp. cx-455]|uniref:cytochrome P450 n=1 Tax=Kocuria sp. cx-455 TaxID=2771377 RepID=UPI001683F5E4|nr:cytochrome P450 [Kocuria sp. cx-455]MBD2765731.1 cytochrome P450 [Kocuria sp. cx-455]